MKVLSNGPLPKFQSDNDLNDRLIKRPSDKANADIKRYRDVLEIIILTLKDAETQLSKHPTLQRQASFIGVIAHELVKERDLAYLIPYKTPEEVAAVMEFLEDEIRGRG